MFASTFALATIFPWESFTSNSAGVLTKTNSSGNFIVVVSPSLTWWSGSSKSISTLTVCHCTTVPSGPPLSLFTVIFFITSSWVFTGLIWTFFASFNKLNSFSLEFFSFDFCFVSFSSLLESFSSFDFIPFSPLGKILFSLLPTLFTLVFSFEILSLVVCSIATAGTILDIVINIANNKVIIFFFIITLLS